MTTPRQHRQKKKMEKKKGRLPLCCQTLQFLSLVFSRQEKKREKGKAQQEPSASHYFFSRVSPILLSATPFSCSPSPFSNESL